MSSCGEVAALLRDWDKIMVISHASHDGDTIGSACGLMRGLVTLGKQVAFCCADEIAPKYRYMFKDIPLGDFQPEHVVSVDVADIDLLGGIRDRFEGRIDIAIDHHGTHVPFADIRWVEPESAATTEMIFLLLLELGVEPDRAMAECIYTGICTDTGCFKYRNVTSRTHRIAARAMELGVDCGEINRIMFDCKSKAQLEAEKQVLEGIEFFCDGKCAMVRIPYNIYAQTGATEGDLDGLCALPRQIEGVLIGVTLKEKEDGSIKGSVRTNPPADSAALCGKFGGGGHEGAAGCSFPLKTMGAAAREMIAGCEEYLKEINLL